MLNVEHGIGDVPLREDTDSGRVILDASRDPGRMQKDFRVERVRGLRRHAASLRVVADRGNTRRLPDDQS